MIYYEWERPNLPACIVATYKLMLKDTIFYILRLHYIFSIAIKFAFKFCFLDSHQWYPSEWPNTYHHMLPCVYLITTGLEWLGSDHYHLWYGQSIIPQPSICIDQDVYSYKMIHKHFTLWLRNRFMSKVSYAPYIQSHTYSKNMFLHTGCKELACTCLIAGVILPRHKR